MTTTQRVSTTPPDMQSPMSAPTSRRSEGSVVITVGPDALDRVRQEARAMTFPNSETERRYIAAVDRAAFDKVHALEGRLIATAERDIEAHARYVDEADAVVDEMLALNTRLERGEDPDSLAEEYRKLSGRARNIRGKLASASRTADFHTAKVGDPYAATQHVIGMLPTGSYGGVDPTPYL